MPAVSSPPAAAASDALVASSPPADPYDRTWPMSRRWTISGREVVVTHPDKLLIPDARVRKLDLVNYYVAVAEGALRGAGGRPA
jgi:hypothetical protein